MLKLILVLLIPIVLLPTCGTAQDEESSAPPTTKHWQLGGAVGIYGNSNLSLGIMSTDGQPLTNSVSPSLRLAVEASYMGPERGINFGFDLDSKKIVQNSDDSIADFRGANGNTSFSVTSFYLNLVRRWQGFYISAGLNLSAVKVSNASLALADISGWPGGQAAVGYYFNPHCALEGGYRLVGISARYEGRFSSESRSGFLEEPMLLLKGYF